MRWALFALLLTLPLLACPPSEPASEFPDTLAWDPREAGPFQVGFAVWEITYTAPATGGPRTIPISVWYPTEDESGEAATYEVIFQDPQSWVDATPAPPVHAGGYPLLVYSHGDQGFAGSSPFLMRHFASHGWVALAPDHIGNTLTTNVAPLPMHLWITRAHDVTAAIDALQGEPGTLAGHVDTSAVVLSGHSFGGFTAWISAGSEFDTAAVQAQCDSDRFADSCTPQVLDEFSAGARDPRLVGAIPMAGTAEISWVGEDGLNAVQIPILQISGTLDADPVSGVFDGRTDSVDITWLEIEGGCHQTFALGSPCDLAAEDGFEMIVSYAFPFGRRQVLGDDRSITRGILDGSIAVDDRAVLYLR
jgi:predicted dienelactone hydrolase